MNKNNTTIMFGVLFSSMILLTTATILQQQNAHASPIKTNLGTTVQAHTGDGFDSGYNKGRSDTLNNHSFSDLCLSITYCDNYKRGYITGWVEMHMATGTPFDWRLLNANTTT